MGKPRVLIVGGYGYLGRLLTLHLKPNFEVVVSTRTLSVNNTNKKTEVRLDLTDRASVDAALAESGPFDVVINTAAISQPSLCERDVASTRAVNVPAHLVSALEGSHTLLIHLSSDQVFDGSTSFSTESTPTNPMNAYGRSKLAAEELIKSSACNHVILRSSIIVGPDVDGVTRPLFTQFIRHQLKEGNKTEYFHDEWRCPVFYKDIAHVITALIHERAAHPEAIQREIYNMGGPERLSRLDMARIVAGHLGIDAKRQNDLIAAISSTETERPYNSPPDISMDSSALVGRIASCPVCQAQHHPSDGDWVACSTTFSEMLPLVFS